jgi:hypothetical protein
MGSVNRILFKRDLVKLIVDGCKTQTRRVVVPQPWEANSVIGGILNRGETSVYRAKFIKVGDGENIDVTDYVQSPYRPGMLLYVSEPFEVKKVRSNSGCSYLEVCYPYVPGLQTKRRFRWTELRSAVRNAFRRTTQLRVISPIFMFREFSRLVLEVTDVRVERLQWITEEDALAEGVLLRGSTRWFGEVRDRFAGLWDSINSKRGFEWKKNPWVWVVSFKIHSSLITN